MMTMCGFCRIQKQVGKPSKRSTFQFVTSIINLGTTWTQEMVWMIGNNLDFVGAKRPLKERFPYLE